MSYVLNQAICIHCDCVDLRFLRPMHRAIGKILGDRARQVVLSNPASHGVARDILRREKGRLVVITAHGSGDYLLGGDYRNAELGGDLPRTRFIDSHQLDVFQDQVVFCLSCDSNALGLKAMGAGALAFAGFDKVPFNRFDNEGNSIGSPLLIRNAQSLLFGAVGATLERFLTRSESLREAVDLLRMQVYSRAVHYVRNNPTVKERREVAALFLQVKDGAKYHGAPSVTFRL